MTDLHELAADFYKDPHVNCSQVMYQHAAQPIAQEVILYALEWRHWSPPQHVLRLLWNQHGFKDPTPFFTCAVFQHLPLWTDILHDLIRERRWHNIAWHSAVQPSAWHGHLRCAPLYLQALLDCDDASEAAVLLRLGASFAAPDMISRDHVLCVVHWLDRGCHDDAMKWLNMLDGERLQHAAPRLLRMPGTDTLLENAVGFAAFQQAVREAPDVCTPVADLVRPLHELDDARLQIMEWTYGGTGFAKIEWHTEQLKRNLPKHNANQVIFEPYDVHQLLLWATRHGTYHMGLPHSAHLVATALREHPQACANCPADLQRLLREHRQRQKTCAELAGSWPLPSELRDMVALYM